MVHVPDHEGSNTLLILRLKGATMVRGDKVAMDSLRKFTFWPTPGDGGHEDL